MQKLSKVIVVVAFFVIFGTLVSAVVTYLVKEQQVKVDEEKLNEQYPNILEGANTGPINLTADYSKSYISGSPLIFGGNHAPLVEDQDAWNQIQEIGVTSIRKDLFPEKAIPKTTIQDYLNNTNGVADPKNWNQTEISKIKDIFINAKKRNIKTIGILAYTPAWLTYTNTGNGVPKNWEVFEDIAKKIYRIHRDNLDYIEIWNEPDWGVFLDMTNSNMTRSEVYEEMFYHAAKAIREVDEEINDGKKIPIGGPTVSDTVQSSILSTLVASPRSNDLLSFISYHNYELKEGQLYPEPSWNIYKDVLSENNIQKPFFITEWNYTADSKKPHPQNTGEDAILYTANKFLDFLKMGLIGANYHILEPLWTSKPNGGDGYFGFYKMVNGKAELVAQARTWKILSKQMGLGNGESKIFNLNENNSSDEDIKTLGFQNNRGEYGIVIINNSQITKPVQLSLLHTNIDSYGQLSIYKASIDNEAKSPIYQGLLKANKGDISLNYFIPSHSVIGIKMQNEKEWYEKIKLSF